MESKGNILLAEDELDFGGVLKQYLELNQFEVHWAKDGEEALSMVKKQEYDICLLDVMMPKLDGFQLAEKLIEIKPEIPFLFLTARKLKEDKLRGLKLGADDYIVKPFEADELVLRITNILKRSKGTKVQEIKQAQIGIYRFDYDNLILESPETTHRITEKEGVLIAFFIKNKNRLVKREAILNEVWQNDDFFSGRSMDVFISRLRKYFKEDNRIEIKSIRGVGLEFRFTE